jgi:hypothetical protein
MWVEDNEPPSISFTWHGPWSWNFRGALPYWAKSSRGELKKWRVGWVEIGPVSIRYTSGKRLFWYAETDN